VSRGAPPNYENGGKKLKDTLEGTEEALGRGAMQNSFFNLRLIRPGHHHHLERRKKDKMRPGPEGLPII